MDNTENPGRDGNLKPIFGGPWSPSKSHARDNSDPPEVQLADAIERAGLRRPDRVILDGKLHRFRTDTKGGPGGGDKPGWYIAFADGIPAGRFGCWRSGIELSWRAETHGRKLSAVEEMAITRRMAEAKAARDAELVASREITAETVDMIWSACAAADPAHPYLARKGIQPHGARVTGDGRLAVPLYDGPDQNVLTSLQYIEADGTKRYHAGGATGGSFWVIGDIAATSSSSSSSSRIFIAEGFATAATIHEATSDPCVVAYSASNLVQVTGAMRKTLTGADIVIVADNDASGIGRKYADQASAKHGARVIIPPIEGDANDYLANGHDLVALLNPPDEPDWLIAADDFSSQPAPIEWLVKGWLQKRSLMMVHGPSGGGKTFAVLDWCLHLAAASTMTTATWNGKKLRSDGGPVIYLAGEGHHGLRSRIAAWKHRHDDPSLNMWLSRAGCDLNTPEGYRRVADAISKIEGSPSLIVVDTLHRFLLGDENSAQDAKTMLDACAGLMEEFNCAVLLVHHTGVSEEAQHRARGSSAWRGALDIEISIVPADKENDRPMQIVQRKSKDAELAEPLYAELNSVEIPGWFDEDGDPVTSAVLNLVDAPPSTTSGSESGGNGRMSKLDEARRTFERAWWSGGAQESSGGLPLVTRDALHDLLVADGFAKRTADNHCRPSDRGRTVGLLLNASLIRPEGNTAWVVIDQKHAAALLIRKSADKTSD